MTLTYEQERRLVSGILSALSYTDEEADIISKVITHSDFTGVYSHGLSRLTRYIRQLRNGSLNNNAHFSKTMDAMAVQSFDGDNGSGILSLNRAFDETIKKAKQFGVAYSTGKHSANIGCGSYYGWRAAENNMICLIGCTTYAFTSPYGGADRLIGTNPIIFAVPTDKQYPIVMDISTTCVAMGKIQAYEREGKPIPSEWAKDYDGSPTTDASKAFSLSPIAAHKGYGLAVMVDVLSCLLSGACYGTDVGLFSKLQPENTGFFIIMLDPSKFMPIEAFKANADRYISMMKNSRKAPGVDEIYMPGEIEFKSYENNMKNGVAFSEALEKELLSLSAELGIISETGSFKELVDKLNT